MHSNFTSMPDGETFAKLWASLDQLLAAHDSRHIGDDRRGEILRSVLLSETPERLAALAASPSGMMESLSRYALPVISEAIQPVNFHSAAAARAEATGKAADGASIPGDADTRTGRRRATYGDLEATRAAIKEDMQLAPLRQLAKDLGAPWLAEMPELLRQLDPNGIKAIAASNLRAPTVQHVMHGPLEFEAKDVVNLARLKEHGIDPDKTGAAMHGAAETVKDDPALLAKMREVYKGYLANPTDEAQKQKMRDLTKDLPREEQRRAHERVLEETHIKQKQEARVDAKVEQTASATAQKDAKAIKQEAKVAVKTAAADKQQQTKLALKSSMAGLD